MKVLFGLSAIGFVIAAGMSAWQSGGVLHAILVMFSIFILLTVIGWWFEWKEWRRQDRINPPPVPAWATPMIWIPILPIAIIGTWYAEDTFQVVIAVIVAICALLLIALRVLLTATGLWAAMYGQRKSEGRE